MGNLKAKISIYSDDNPDKVQGFVNTHLELYGTNVQDIQYSTAKNNRNMGNGVEYSVMIKYLTDE